MLTEIFANQNFVLYKVLIYSLKFMAIWVSTNLFLFIIFQGLFSSLRHKVLSSCMYGIPAVTFLVLIFYYPVLLKRLKPENSWIDAVLMSYQQLKDKIETNIERYLV